MDRSPDRTGSRRSRLNAQGFESDPRMHAVLDPHGFGFEHDPPFHPIDQRKTGRRPWLILAFSGLCSPCASTFSPWPHPQKAPDDSCPAGFSQSGTNRKRPRPWIERPDGVLPMRMQKVPGSGHHDARIVKDRPVGSPHDANRPSAAERGHGVIGRRGVDNHACSRKYATSCPLAGRVRFKGIGYGSLKRHHETCAQLGHRSSMRSPGVNLLRGSAEPEGDASERGGLGKLGAKHAHAVGMHPRRSGVAGEIRQAKIGLDESVQKGNGAAQGAFQLRPARQGINPCEGIDHAREGGDAPPAGAWFVVVFRAAGFRPRDATMRHPHPIANTLKRDAGMCAGFREPPFRVSAGEEPAEVLPRAFQKWSVAEEDPALDEGCDSIRLGRGGNERGSAGKPGEMPLQIAQQIVAAEAGGFGQQRADVEGAPCEVRRIPPAPFDRSAVAQKGKLPGDQGGANGRDEAIPLIRTRRIVLDPQGQGQRGGRSVGQIRRGLRGAGGEIAPPDRIADDFQPVLRPPPGEGKSRFAKRVRPDGMGRRLRLAARGMRNRWRFGRQCRRCAAGIVRHRE